MIHDSVKNSHVKNTGKTAYEIYLDLETNDWRGCQMMTAYWFGS
jgi:hypothetical protein